MDDAALRVLRTKAILLGIEAFESGTGRYAPRVGWTITALEHGTSDLIARFDRQFTGNYMWAMFDTEQEALEAFFAFVRSQHENTR